MPYQSPPSSSFNSPRSEGSDNVVWTDNDEGSSGEEAGDFKRDFEGIYVSFFYFIFFLNVFFFREGTYFLFIFF